MLPGGKFCAPIRLLDIDISIIYLIVYSGHCKKLEPVFLEVGKYYKGHPMVTVAKVDATRFVKAAEHFEVRGYPTIK